MAAVTYSNTDLNRFWLQMLGDSALITLNAFSPEEVNETRQAKALADRFDALALRANQNPTADQTAQLNRDAFQATQDLRKFYLQILNLMLTSIFHIDLKPEQINCFVNGTERYLSLLDAFTQNKKPSFDPLLEETFWLPVFTICNRYIAGRLGYFQEQNREKAQKLASVINKYWAYSVQLMGISRIGTEDFPLVQEHHVVVADVLNGYYEFLKNLISLKEQKKQPGSMSLLYLDHSRRMVCFFLKQMAVVIDSKAPDCDPYAERISSI